MQSSSAFLFFIKFFISVSLNYNTVFCVDKLYKLGSIKTNDLYLTDLELKSLALWVHAGISNVSLLN